MLETTEKVPDGFLSEFIEQEKVRIFLWRAYKTGRIASAYLFSGPAGIGKFIAAYQWVKFLKCPNKSDGKPCGKCKSCTTMDSWTNPDVLIIFPMPKSVWDSEARRDAYAEFRLNPFMRPRFDRKPSIILDMIYEIQQFLQTPATSHGGKFVIIADAELMNIPAAKSFLKTLEEPPLGSYIIMTSQRPEALLPTIRSRTQEIKFRRLSERDILKKLKDRFDVPHELAAEVSRLADGSIANALRYLTPEFEALRRQALKIIEAACERNYEEVWSWADEAPAKTDYAEQICLALITILRDMLASIIGDEVSVMNSSEEELIKNLAKSCGDIKRIERTLAGVTAHYENLLRNPQYRLFYGSLAATLLGI
ncbi:hypothetical protein DRQ27_01440 [bacterium]|nr:MAG: hypothetical protein DRQ27_01440 [bacterium]